MKGTRFILLFILCFAIVLAHLDSIAFADPVPTTLDDFFLPGSQPLESGTFQTPDQCDNCHGGYDLAVEPSFNWDGSMMAQAMRDPLYLAGLAVANQDAPEVGDLCIRCHTPPGWLEGRSLPTNGSSLTADDRFGVQCHYCHREVKPSQLGVNPYPLDSVYTADTYSHDQSYLATIDSLTDISGNGMYIVDSDNTRRGPYIETVAQHATYYSPFHRDANLCGTCHDVSNPVFDRQPDGSYTPNAFGQPISDYSPYAMFPIERTFSEWLMSDYNTPQGVYAPQFGGNRDTVATCQDCHMRDVTGAGCDRTNAPIRDDLPLHDMTGGNTFIPLLIESVYPGEANLAALDSGIVRARYMLQNAATMNLTSAFQDSAWGLTVRVYNQTGHKLISGYPEGRRMWLNVRAYNSLDSLVYESGAYDTATAILDHDPDVKIYQIKPGISPGLSTVVNIPAGPSFHMVLNDTIYFDNRIPPRGFTNANYELIQSPPIGYSYNDGEYWDDTDYSIPLGTAEVEVTLYYQTVSKEFVEFLRDADSTAHMGDTLYTLWEAFGKSPPELMVSDSYTFPVGGTPTAVEDLISSISGSDIVLTWSPVTQDTSGLPVVVDYYRIYRDTDPEFMPSVPSLLDSTLTATYTDPGVLTAPDPAYFYRVSAVVVD